MPLLLQLGKESLDVRLLRVTVTMILLGDCCEDCEVEEQRDDPSLDASKTEPEAQAPSKCSSSGTLQYSAIERT